MRKPVQITFHNVDPSDAVKALIEEKAAWLERYYDRITGCRVVVESPHRRHRNGNAYQVRIDLTVPGGEIAVNRESSGRQAQPDLYVAVRDAFDAARRKLEEHTRRLRQEVKSHEPAPHARVGQLFLDEGYGFLTTPDGREVYFHRHAVVNGDFEHLRVGSEVTFVEEEGEKGPQASTIRLAGRHNRG
jgi:ribosomal subunit interface protein